MSVYTSRNSFYRVFILVVVFFTGSVSAQIYQGSGSYTEKVDEGVYKKKAWNGDWQGCPTATVSCDSDQYLVGEETKGTTSEYSSYSCRPQWYADFKAVDSCSTKNIGDEWLDLSKERGKDDAVKGGTLSKEQCGASGGGGPEAVAAVTALCYEDSAFEEEFCNYRGPFNECIMNETNQLDEKQYNVPSIFDARENAVFQALNGPAVLNITNSTSILGMWKGAFRIQAKKPRINPGADLKPQNGDIVIGKR